MPMSAYQQRSLAIHHANLVAELRELELLRERVKTAERLLGTSRRTAVGRKRLVQPRKRRESVVNYRPRLPLRG